MQEEGWEIGRKSSKVNWEGGNGNEREHKKVIDVAQSATNLIETTQGKIEKS